MNEVYEKFQQSQRKVRKYEEMYAITTRCIPPVSRQFVVLMMNGSHSQRLVAALARITKDYTVCYACTEKGPSDPGSFEKGSYVLGFVAFESTVRLLHQLSIECVYDAWIELCTVNICAATRNH